VHGATNGGATPFETRRVPQQIKKSFLGVHMMKKCYSLQSIISAVVLVST
jgi:hypothetical protein